jgi:DNA-binding XRE family transcriptional regulator
VNDFSALLRSYRKSQGLTQEALARHWSYSFETISAWERGKRTPSTQEIPRLASLLAIEAQELTRLVAVSKGRATGVKDDMQQTLPFTQGRLLWSLHLGIEDGLLRGMISCPLASGKTWEIDLNAETDFADIQNLYRIVSEQVASKAVNHQFLEKRSRSTVISPDEVA